ncbi:hypothetical protein ACMFMF_005730 [Clarireedia jacksonii]
MFLKRFLPLFSIYTTSVPVFAASWIVPGALWTDAIGTKIDAHGGGVFQYGDTFYWVGQGDSDSACHGSDVFIERSTELGKSWFAEWGGEYVETEGGEVGGEVLVGGYAVTRPAVYLPPNNYSYSDTGMFLDDDGTWYLLTSADHNTVQVNKIHTNGTIGARVNSLTGAPYEAPGMIKVDGIYFLIVSGKTAYQHNPNKMFWTTSINGTWTGPFDIAPNTTNTYNSQNTYELAIHGSQRTTYVYMGDQWDLTGSEASNYMWLPMVIDSSNKTLTLEYHSMWKVDVSTGIISFPTVAKRYEAEHAKLSGCATISHCAHCIRKRAVYGSTGSPQWISFHYTVNNPKAGEAYIYINGHSILKLSALNSRAGYSKNVPVELILNRGDENVIEFGAAGSQDFEVEIEGLELYEEES